jgi:hypothetical protein
MFLPCFEKDHLSFHDRTVQVSVEWINIGTVTDVLVRFVVSVSKVRKLEKTFFHPVTTSSVVIITQ